MLLPCSSTPAGLTHLALTMRRRGPRCVHDEGSHVSYFRGSITRLRHWLSTLRRPGYPDATQDSLPAVGQALPDGLDYPQGSNERFSGCILHPSSFPKFNAAQGHNNQNSPAVDNHEHLLDETGMAENYSQAQGLAALIHPYSHQFGRCSPDCQNRSIFGVSRLDHTFVGTDGGRFDRRAKTRQLIHPRKRPAFEAL